VTTRPKIAALTPRQEKDCLAFYPFEGDETPVTQLRDVFVVTRYPHECQCCSEVIPPGTRSRALTEVNHDCAAVGTARYCLPCCSAMASSWTDDGKAIDERFRVGERNRERARRRSAR
jgi:hypothetical protein